MHFDLRPGLPCGSFLLMCLASLTNLCGCNSWDQKCGWATINPQTTICCEGLIYVRDGIQPTCCGSIAYDAFYSYCCNGRVQAKNKNNRCCGNNTYDTRYQVCHPNDNIVERHLTGSTCCRDDTKWKCCKQGQGCCTGSRGGSVDVPGFRPACCDIASQSSKARCCSSITQKTGIMPTCCNADRVRPICCKTSTSSFKCCQSGHGLPRCCQTEDTDDDSNGGNIYHPYRLPSTTPVSTNFVPVHPTPLPRPGSCCHSQSPQPYCCQVMKPNYGPRPRPNIPESSVQASKPRCCIYRYSCCAVSQSNTRHNQCCNRASNGARPLCCKQQAPTTYLPPAPSRHDNREHKCYSCKINGNYESIPLVSTDDDQANNVDYGGGAYSSHRGNGYSSNRVNDNNSYEGNDYGSNRGSSNRGKDYSSTGGGQGWARLSCCQSNYHQQCCRNAYRLTGIYAQCCDNSIIADSNNARPSPAGSNGKQAQWASGHGTKQEMCSGQPYDGTYLICCYGALRPKVGSQASCCGTKVFNSATHKCCSGRVKRTCARPSNGGTSSSWTYFSKR